MPILDGFGATKGIRLLEGSHYFDTSEKSLVVGLTAHATEEYEKLCY